MSDTPTGQSPAADRLPSDASPHREAGPSDFAPTHPGEPSDKNADWWPESADGQCSENAALFAASQPAPLNVV